jgi:hypothetical protein
MPQNPFQELDLHRKVGLSMIDLQKLGLEHLADDMTTKIKKHFGDIFYHGLVPFPQNRFNI